MGLEPGRSLLLMMGVVAWSDLLSFCIVESN